MSIEKIIVSICAGAILLTTLLLARNSILFFTDTEEKKSVSAVAPAPPDIQAETQLGTIVERSEEEWKEMLTEMQYNVARQHGTEPSFNNAYWDEKRKGTYKCIGCGEKLFSSDAKFDSGTGWPSYWQPVDLKHVETKEDNTFFSRRTEVHCSRCKSHLGHIFEDGPQPTGLRYCINSASLKFESEDNPESTGAK